VSTTQLTINDREFTVSREAVRIIQADPAQADLLYAALTDFRTFLRYWRFTNGETGRTEVLGDAIWPGQQRIIDAMIDHPQVILAKSRKVGASTLEIAYCGYVLRTRPEGLVSLVSYRQEASNNLHRQVLAGLRALPPLLQLPLSHTATTITLQGGGMSTAFPANERSAADVSTVHLCCDELGRMVNAEQTWQSLQPSIAGSCHVLSTCPGPESLMADLWRRSEHGETRLHPVFVSALERPDRNEAWYEQMKRDLGSARARVEYPLTPEDFLAGVGDRFFNAADIERATTLSYGLRPYVTQEQREIEVRARMAKVSALGLDPYPVPYHQLRPKYVAGVDVGVRDAFVLTALDVTERETWDVAAFIHETGLTYPQMARYIEQAKVAYPGIFIMVEANAAGTALIQNVRVPVEEFWTTARSKDDLLYNLQAKLENDELALPPQGCERLLYELRLYQVPDKAIAQDCVMSLALAVHAGIQRQARQGRTTGPIMV
jgi:hypothetical protein